MERAGKVSGSQRRPQLVKSYTGRCSCSISALIKLHFGDLESISVWNELAKLVARKIEPSVLRARITQTLFGEIVYESLFVLEIVNSTSAAQKAKMILDFFKTIYHCTILSNTI